MHRLLTLFTLSVLVAGSAAAVASACGDGPAPRNLPVYGGMRTTLRTLYLRAHPNLASSEVAGPIAGRTYYGYNGDFHAVAWFRVAGHEAYPSVFWHSAQHPWRYVRESLGAGVRDSDVSPDLLYTWGFTQWRTSHFYVAPR